MDEPQPEEPAVPPTVQVLISRLALEDIRWRHDAEQQLVKLGAPVVPALIAALAQHANPTVRYHVVMALAQLGDERAVGPLVAALGDAEARSAVATIAEKALVTSFAARAVPELLVAASSGSHAVRARAVRTLGRIPGPHSAQMLSLLKDPDAAVRAQAVSAVASLGGGGVARQIIEALQDPEEWVRHAAAEALVDMKRGEGRAVLERATHDEDDMYTRNWALGLLDRIEELERLEELQPPLPTGPG